MKDEAKVVGEFSNFLSDYVYNNKYTLEDMKIAFAKATAKLKKEVEGLYKRIR